jgi:NRAMP (natural resistance-associated macrophage protein)-like metal ion transporter
MSQLVQAMRAGPPVRFPRIQSAAGAASRADGCGDAVRSHRNQARLAPLCGARRTCGGRVRRLHGSGNFATNIQAGSRYGYDLLWVVVLANLGAMLFQALSAKLGLVTGRNLAELCRDRLPASLVWTMWVVSEIAAMATDLAEFLGGAIGLSLTLNLPLLSGMAATAVIVYAMLSLQCFGFRPIELAIGGLVAAIGISYLAEVLIAPIDWAEAARHSVLLIVESFSA